MRKWMTAAVVLGLLLLAGCGAEAWTKEERTAQRHCEKAGKRIAAVLGQTDAAERAETILAEAGYDVLFRRPEPYLPEPEGLKDFLTQVQAGKTGAAELYQVHGDGYLSCLRFWQKDGQFYATYAACDPRDKGKETVRETHRVLDWYLSERDYFYYRIYGEDDQHYADYNRILLKKPDEDLDTLTRDCILPVGYTGVNLFLLDWTGSRLGGVSVNDLWDCLEGQRIGHRPDPGAEDFPYDRENGCYWIPASRFEDVLLDRLPLSREQLRAAGGYDADKGGYPWIPLESELAARFSHPVLAPEVTACRENGDGTLTLTVEAASTDLKTDCLFSHEVTVLPLGAGEYRYLGNRMLTPPPEQYPLRQSRSEVSKMGVSG